jgi:cell division protein FtsW (lipid II flippase)
MSLNPKKRGYPSLWNVFAPSSEDKNHQREAALLCLAFAFLSLVGVGLTLSTAARMQDWGSFPGMLAQLSFLPVWAVGAWLLHREVDRAVPRRDPFLLPIALLLSGWGTLVIWRLNPAFGLRQMLWFSLACVLMLGLFRLDPKLSWLRNYRYLWMSLALALLGMTLFLGTNPLGGEPRLWLGCCGVYFQPSEPLRFFLVAFLASYLGDRLRLSGAVRTGLPWRDFLPLILVWGVSVLLLVVQRDLGTGMIFLALLAVLLFSATGAWQVLVLSAVVAFGGGGLSYFLFDVVQVRVQAWLNPWLDPTSSSYQIVQSLISIASGGIVGRGPGLGSPGFVPASHTDFIFAAVSEEFGLAGAVAIIALFAVFVNRGLKIGRRHSDMFGRFLTFGLTLTLGLQAIFIIGGVMRVLPLVGITLPFVSYGGSSLLTSFASLAILLLLSQPEDPDNTGFRAFDSIQIGFSLTWALLAFIAGWWTIYRAPNLVARTDNPRRAMDTRFVKRGLITDRNESVLAESIGGSGEFERVYPYAAAAPVVGFDSMVYGQSGVEDSMDDVLRGLERGSLFENTWHRMITGHPPEGENISLTLDIELQSLAMDLLAGRTGAAVLLEAHSGDLFVLASQPSYDPNMIEESWVDLIQDEDAPLFNRVTQGLYQPGLSIVPFLAAQATAQGVMDLDSMVAELGGTVDVNGESLTCSLAPPRSAARTLANSLRYGCPEPIQQALLEADWSATQAAIRSFGLTVPLDIKLESAVSEEPGDVPPDSELAQLVVGQGDLRVTPLHMARAFGGLFAGEPRAPLRLVRAIDVDDGGWVEQESVGYRVPTLSNEVVSALKEVYSVGQTGLYDLRAQAISGSEGQLQGWYLGVLDSRERAWVVVVVLEGTEPYEAEGIGREILEAAQRLTP